MFFINLKKVNVTSYNTTCAMYIMDMIVQIHNIQFAIELLYSFRSVYSVIFIPLGVESLQSYLMLNKSACQQVTLKVSVISLDC